MPSERPREEDVQRVLDYVAGSSKLHVILANRLGVSLLDPDKRLGVTSLEFVISALLAVKAQIRIEEADDAE